VQKKLLVPVDQRNYGKIYIAEDILQMIAYS